MDRGVTEWLAGTIRLAQGLLYPGNAAAASQPVDQLVDSIRVAWGLFCPLDPQPMGLKRGPVTPELINACRDAIHHLAGCKSVHYFCNRIAEQLERRLDEIIRFHQRRVNMTN